VIPKLGAAAPKGAPGVSQGWCEFLESGLLLNITEYTDKRYTVPHEKIHKGTWKSPDQLTVNQIDHLLMDGRHGPSLLQVRVYRGANVIPITTYFRLKFGPG
jgi:hypothetical protein